MKKELIISSICLTLIVMLGVGGFFYTQHVTETIKADYSVKVNTLQQKLDDTQQKNTEIFQAQQTQLQEQNIKIVEHDQSINLIQKEVVSKVGELTGQLENVKKQSQQELAKLTTKLSDVELKSVSQLSELKKQISNLDLSEGFTNVVSQVIPGVVNVQRSDGKIGSGAIVSSAGHIITNKHVAEGDEVVFSVETYDGKSYPATVVGFSSNYDLAILKITPSGSWTVLTFDNSDTLKIGERVVAIGSPAGLSFSVTEGIVSQFPTVNGVKYIQIDAPINPGNSGGPLINTAGKIIGINTAKITGFEGIGFSIPSNRAKELVDQLAK